MVIRRAQRKPLTAVALAGVEREAAKAGITLAEAIRECAERGWIGFKAEWLAKAGGGKAGSKWGGVPKSFEGVDYGESAEGADLDDMLRQFMPSTIGPKKQPKGKSDAV